MTKPRAVSRRARIVTAFFGAAFIVLLVTVVVTNVMLLARGSWFVVIAWPMAGLSLFFGGKMLYEMYGVVRYGDWLWRHPEYGVKARAQYELEAKAVAEKAVALASATPPFSTGTVGPTGPAGPFTLHTGFEGNQHEDWEIEDLGTAIEPIIAYREWVVAYSPRIGEYRLRSFWGQDLWKPRQAHQALCLAGAHNPFVNAARAEGVLVGHDAPHIECTCGIYARESLEQLNTDSSGAYGHIHLWGKIVICERGYRAEYAYPKDLVIQGYAPKASARAKQDIEEAYGIPVSVIAGGEELE